MIRSSTLTSDLVKATSEIVKRHNFQQLLDDYPELRGKFHAIGRCCGLPPAALRELDEYQRTDGRFKFCHVDWIYKWRPILEPRPAHVRLQFYNADEKQVDCGYYHPGPGVTHWRYIEYPFTVPRSG